MIESDQVAVSIAISAIVGLIVGAIFHNRGSKIIAKIKVVQDEIKEIQKEQSKTITEINELQQKHQEILNDIDGSQTELSHSLKVEFVKLSKSIEKIKRKQKVAVEKPKIIDRIETTQYESSPEIHAEAPQVDERIGFIPDETYREKVSKCIALLYHSKWRWRTEETLKEKSKMTDDEFDYFITHESDIRESDLPDINGNRIFGLRSRVG